MRETRASCPYCGTGCGVIVESRGKRIVGVRGDPQHPANFGKLCAKGATLHLAAQPDLVTHARLLQPELRACRDERRRQVDWDTALDYAAQRFATAIGNGSNGPNRVAFYVSGQLQTEDYYVFNKLARALVGTNNIDSNSRLCMSSAVVGYKRTLGADAPPCSYEDVELADFVLIAGANPAVAHPVLFGRLLEARRKRGTWLAVVDPRATDTSRAADVHLPLAPGSDLYLFSAMLHVMLRDGLINNKFIDASTAGFEAVAAQVRSLDLTAAASRCALPLADIERVAREFARAPAALSLYCQGLNQSAHGSDNNAALIHLHLATGQIGRPGAGPFSLTGQPNAMGGRESGSMATLLPGHRDPGCAADRDEVARLWGIDPLPAQPGLTAVELFEAAADGAIDALWIACTNPAQSLPNQIRVRAALQRVPFVVVQDAFAHTETAAFADLLLPAATFGEREGTSTNSERRITLSRAAVAPPHAARPDWVIAAQFARKLARRIAPDRERLFDWVRACDVFDEYKELTAGRDLDISALTYATLEYAGPQQWPFAGERKASQRLYGDGRFATADGRARFVLLTMATLAEPASDLFPFSLTTTRLRDQWHGGSRTGLIGALGADAPAVELAPAALLKIGTRDDELVQIRSVRGALIMPVREVDGLAETLAVVPMHYGPRFLPAGAGVNMLTLDALDPLSHQPELKHAAVAIEPVHFDWHFAAIGWANDDDRYAQLEMLRAVATRTSYSSVTTFGRDERRLGIVVSAAHVARLSDLVDLCSNLFGVDADAPMLHDARAGRLRRLQIDAGCAQAALLEGRCRSDIAAWRAYRSLIERGDDCSRRPLQSLFAPAAA
jgi:assimilatory nitrate reductase catalytic subunit